MDKQVIAMYIQKDQVFPDNFYVGQMPYGSKVRGGQTGTLQYQRYMS